MCTLSTTIEDYELLDNDAETSEGRYLAVLAVCISYLIVAFLSAVDLYPRFSTWPLLHTKFAPYQFPRVISQSTLLH